jgi:hypothetical protein
MFFYYMQDAVASEMQSYRFAGAHPVRLSNALPLPFRSFATAVVIAAILRTCPGTVTLHWALGATVSRVLGQQLLAGFSLIGFAQSEKRHSFTVPLNFVPKSHAVPAHDLELCD